MKKTILITLAAAFSLGNSFAQDQMHPVKPGNPTNNVQVAPNPGNQKAINPKNPVDPKPSPVINPKNPVDPKRAPISPKKSTEATQEKQEKMQQEKQMQLQQKHHVAPHPALPVPGPKSK